MSAADPLARRASLQDTPAFAQSVQTSSLSVISSSPRAILQPPDPSSEGSMDPGKSGERDPLISSHKTTATAEVYRAQVPPAMPSPLQSPEASASAAASSVRIVYVNQHERHKELGYRFCNNAIKTSKYNIFTFLPYNLYEQGRRLANLYFLLISALQQIPGLSPTGKYTTLGPLVVVLAVTAAKEAWEDFRRHRRDREVNNRICHVMRNGSFVPILWHELRVGDLVRLENRDFIPADIILLNSSEPRGICYIETSSLDGETNLKIRQSRSVTEHMSTDEQIATLEGARLITEMPNASLYTFNGTIEIQGTTTPLGPSQVLLRGAQLRNTHWVYGLVFFTGKDSKLVKNSSGTPLKRTSLEKQANVQILFLCIIEFLISLGCAIGFALWERDHGYAHWYLAGTTLSTGANIGLGFITFLILFNNLIPISLYVTMEFVKIGQAFFINNDMEMYHVASNTPAEARTSNLNEELGQVQYIFSDKTGTLTCNMMEFRRCSVGGVAYGSFDDTEETGEPIPPEWHPRPSQVPYNFYSPRFEHESRAPSVQGQLLREFLTLLAVCHTVVPEPSKDKPSEIIFNAASPDEAALVGAADYLGFRFRSLSPRLVVEQLGELVEYELLNVLEFNSNRKRMSVIVRTPDGRIMLYCKGADSTIFPLLAPENPLAHVTLEHMQDFAVQGLRTLLLAKAELSMAYYVEWDILYKAAANSIVNREAELEKVAELVEREMYLVGATAIEDKLQEGVPEAIETLSKAGIRIWVLTGDKQETAINIGYSSRLLNDDMEKLIVNETTSAATHATLTSLLTRWRPPGTPEGASYKYSMNARQEKPLALVIDGATLEFALTPPLHSQLLCLALMCKAVICCRVSPAQKASVVRLVRDNLKAISLAIGDGANDINMIQSAHVGVGISGLEGLQAARASDYSIAQFRFLVRLLLVHGRQSYRQTSKVLLYCFYKNIVLYISQFWFTTVNGFSGTSLYERWTLGTYNLLFTAFPIVFFGLLDRDLSADVLTRQFPQLYQVCHQHVWFRLSVFWGYMATGVFHSLVIFFVPYAIFYHGNCYQNGRVIDLYSWGLVTYTCAVWVANLKLVFESRYMTWLNHLVIWGSMFVLWFLWLIVYGSLGWLDMGDFSVGWDTAGSFFEIARTPLYLFTVLLVPVIALFRDFAWSFYRRTYRPRDYHIVQELELVGGQDSELLFMSGGFNDSNGGHVRMMESAYAPGGGAHGSSTVLSSSPSMRRSGYSFSAEPGQAQAMEDAVRAAPSEARSQYSTVRSRVVPARPADPPIELPHSIGSSSGP